MENLPDPFVAGRYDRLATFLNKNGIAVIAIDHEGKELVMIFAVN